MKIKALALLLALLMLALPTAQPLTEIAIGSAYADESETGGEETSTPEPAEAPTPEPTETPTPEPEPTPEPTEEPVSVTETEEPDDAVDDAEIILSDSLIRLQVGKEYALTYSLLPESGEPFEVEWLSSDAEIAAVEAGEIEVETDAGDEVITVAAGIVTAVAEGIAIITVRSVEDADVLAECTVEVILGIDDENETLIIVHDRVELLWEGDLPEHIPPVPLVMPKAEVVRDGSMTSFSIAALSEMSLEDTIRAGLEAGLTDIDVFRYNIPLSDRSELSAVYFSLLNLNPHYFYIAGSYSAAYYGGDIYVRFLRPTYKYTGQALSDKIAEFDSNTNKILAAIPSGTTPLEKALALNDYFAIHFRYSDDGKDSKKFNHALEVLFTDLHGVCQAYALGYQHMMNQLGIPGRYATSTAMNHAWNVIQINGSWYHVDVTWNDPVPDRGGRARHEYFLHSDGSFETGLTSSHHSWDISTSATDTTFDDFFWRNVNAAFAFCKGGWYFMRNNTSPSRTQLCRWDAPSNSASVIHEYNARWDAGDGYVWTGSYGGVVSAGDVLLFSMPKGIYSIDPTQLNPTPTLVYTPPGLEGLTSIYGFFTRDGKYYYTEADTPNEAGTIKEIPTSALEIAQVAINAPTITLAAPVAGQTPATSIDATQFTGTVSWTPAVTGVFVGATQYTATITLTPKWGYTLTGVSANFFAVAGATSVTNSADSGVVTAVFPATGEWVSAYNTGDIAIVNNIITANGLNWALAPGDGSSIPAAWTSGWPNSAGMAWSSTAPRRLRQFNMTNMGLTGTLDLTGLTELIYLACGNNSLSALNISDSTKLQTLACYSNELSALDVSGFPALTYLDCVGNNLSVLDVSNNVNLTHLACGMNPLLGVLDVSNCTKLTLLECGLTNVRALDLSNCPDLVNLRCLNSPVTELTLANGHGYSASSLPAAGGQIYFGNYDPYDPSDFFCPENKIQLWAKPNNGYDLADWTVTANGNDHQYLPGVGDSISIPQLPDRVTVTANFALSGTRINIASIPGVAVPVGGGTSATNITATTQYTGTVAWSPNDATFVIGTTYTATITLIPNPGFTLTGVAANFFTVAGATATNAANRGIVSAVFPATAALPVGSITVTGAGNATTITAKGGTLQMNAAVQPVNATDPTVTWTVANGTGSATINSTGLLTAVTNGTVTVRATANDGSGVFGQRVITITGQSAVTGVTVSPLTATVKKGETETFTAVVTGTMEPDQAVTWTVDGDLPGTTIIGGALSIDADETAETLSVRATSVQDSSKSGEATVTVVAIDALENITVQQSKIIPITLPEEEEEAATQQLTVIYTPEGTTQDGIRWTSNNPSVATVNETTGLVTAKAPGTASIAAISTHNASIYDYVWVRVLPAPTQTPKYAIDSSDAAIDASGKIQVDFVKSGAINLIAVHTETSEPVAVTWKSSDTKVATVSAAGVVRHIASGITTITATVKTGEDKGKTADVTLVLMDRTPRLPVSAITVNTNSEGTKFTVLPTDTFFDYDDVAILTDKFEIQKISPTTYQLSASGAAAGRHFVDLQAMKGEDAVGIPFRLTVSVVTAMPKATVRMPALNTFWKGASGRITVTGTNLPKIENLALTDTGRAADGNVTENFTVTFDAVTSGWFITAVDVFTSFTDAQKTKPAVKGILEIYYEGFTSSLKVNVTVSIKDTVPKLTFAPATQTISMNALYDPEATFAVAGGKLDRVVPAPGVAANNVIEEVTSTASGFTVALNGTAKASNALQLQAWLEGAAKPIVLRPTIRTTTAAATYKLSSATVTLNSTLEDQMQIVAVIPSVANVPVTGLAVDPAAIGGIEVEPNGRELAVTVQKDTPAGTYRFNVTSNEITRALVLTVKVEEKALVATVKADKGNIDLMNQSNTLLIYTPTIRGTASTITGVAAAPASKIFSDDRTVVRDPDGKDDYQKFDVQWNSKTEKVEIRTLEDETYRKGATYRLRLAFAMSSGDTINTADIIIKPAQSVVRHGLPKTLTMYQSRTTVLNYTAVDLMPFTPVGARIETFGFKSEKNAAKPVNNPGNAYWYYFDDDAQELHVWIRDGALLKPGKATLVFSVTYQGQGIENLGAKAVPPFGPKPLDIKLPVTVVK